MNDLLVKCQHLVICVYKNKPGMVGVTVVMSFLCDKSTLITQPTRSNHWLVTNLHIDLLCPICIMFLSTVTYRGCFDGWIGGMVRNNYVGCQTQIYFGKAVEWCFCNSVGTDQGQPCNGQSRDVIAQNAATYGRRKSYADYGSAVAKSGYDNYQEGNSVK